MSVCDSDCMCDSDCRCVCLCAIWMCDSDCMIAVKSSRFDCTCMYVQDVCLCGFVYLNTVRLNSFVSMCD